MADNKDTWRLAAKQILKDVPGADVPRYGNVHEMQDGAGAFVECVVWVPKNDESFDEHKS